MFITAKIGNKLKCLSTSEWINKLLYSFKRTLLSNKKVIHAPIWKNFKLSERRQTKNEYCMIPPVSN